MSTLTQAISLQIEHSGEYEYERGCKGKIAHPTYESAKRIARRMHKLQHRQFGVYECRFCSAFHVGGRRKR